MLCPGIRSVGHPPSLPSTQPQVPTITDHKGAIKGTWGVLVGYNLGMLLLLFLLEVRPEAPNSKSLSGLDAPGRVA